MAYIVQGDGADGNAVSVTTDDQREALAEAVDLTTRGCTNIKIIGSSRIYTMEELAAAIINADY